MSLLGVELGFRVHWKILGICQWLLINQSFSQVGKHLGFSRLDYLFSTNMNQELKMRVYIVGSFVFSTIYNLVFPLPVMASPVESLGCSISKVLKDGDDITLTHLWHRERLAGGRNVPSGTVVEANVPTSSFTTKKLFGWGDACGKWLLSFTPICSFSPVVWISTIFHCYYIFFIFFPSWLTSVENWKEKWGCGRMWNIQAIKTLEPYLIL